MEKLARIRYSNGTEKLWVLDIPTRDFYRIITLAKQKGVFFKIRTEEKILIINPEVIAEIDLDHVPMELSSDYCKFLGYEVVTGIETLSLVIEDPWEVDEYDEE